MKTPIIQNIPSSIMENVNQILKPWRNDNDVQYFYNIIKGNEFSEGNISLTIRIGSARRLNRKHTDPKLEPVFYDELKIELIATAKSFSLSAFIFHNEQNKTEGFSYLFNPELEVEDEFKETVVLPEGNNGRCPEHFFADLTKLIKLNRDIRIESILGSLKNNE